MRETDLRLNRNKSKPAESAEMEQDSTAAAELKAKPVLKGRRRLVAPNPIIAEPKLKGHQTEDKPVAATAALKPHDDNLPWSQDLRALRGKIYDASSSASGENSARLSPPSVSSKGTSKGKTKVKDELTVTVRSLRNTPSRLRARCERGRIASDTSSTSSGISDSDASSSSSSSDRDSGIETSAPSGQGKQMFGETDTVAKGIRDMKIAAVEAVTDSVTMTPVTPTKNSLPPLKLTLRKKLSPVLDEVLASVSNLPVSASAAPAAVNSQQQQQPAQVSAGGRRRRRRPAGAHVYEVLRMEGVADEDRQNDSTTPVKNDSRSSDSSDSYHYHQLRTKRIRLKLGDETLSSIDLNQTS